MKYVGYNQGYFVPGSNVAAWLEYSGVNAVRLWADLRTYVHPEWVDNKSIVKDPDEFDRLKRIFRDNPLNGNLVRWDSIDATASRLIPSTNTMVLKYALQELNKQGIDIVLQSGYRVKAADWSEKWLQWQRYYALAFYLAREGNVHMFAMQNEPNHRHAGPVPLDIWIDMMRIASDAIRCAIADVNRIYEKHLTPRFVGPVTAGTNTNWWAKIAASERIDYRGNKCDYDLIDIFSTHSYNLPAAGYEGKVQSIDKILRDNHPLHDTKPIVFTEIGRWMNAYLIDKEETMDSPSLFTEWAGIYTRNMQGGGYGMWAFKFANTASSTYPRGIKSGHHYIWKGKRFAEDSYENLALGTSQRNRHRIQYDTVNRRKQSGRFCVGILLGRGEMGGNRPRPLNSIGGNSHLYGFGRRSVHRSGPYPKPENTDFRQKRLERHSRYGRNGMPLCPALLYFSGRYGRLQNQDHYP